LLWVGSAFEQYEWLENLGTVPLQLRSHISSLKLYDLYKPLHCIHTHARARHNILKTQSSLVEHRAFAILIFKTKLRHDFFLFFLGETSLLHHKQPVRFHERPRARDRTLVSSATVFNFQQSFDEKEKETWRERGRGREREEEKHKLGAAEKSQTTSSQTLSISERSLSSALTLIVPSILRNFQWSPTIFQT